jgi:hypothetical protein
MISPQLSLQKGCQTHDPGICFRTAIRKEAAPGHLAQILGEAPRPAIPDYCLLLTESVTVKTSVAPVQVRGVKVSACDIRQIVY